MALWGIGFPVILIFSNNEHVMNWNVSNFVLYVLIIYNMFYLSTGDYLGLNSIHAIINFSFYYLKFCFNFIKKHSLLVVRGHQIQMLKRATSLIQIGQAVWKESIEKNEKCGHPKTERQWMELSVIADTFLYIVFKPNIYIQHQPFSSVLFSWRLEPVGLCTLVLSLPVMKHLECWL